jgi:hypothetical protein
MVRAGRQAHSLIPDTALASAAKFVTWKLVGEGQRCDVIPVPDVSIIYEPFSVVHPKYCQQFLKFYRYLCIKLNKNQ